MKQKGRQSAMVLAVLAALFYAVSFPFSKLLLREAGPVMMAALLYLGAGAGIGLLYFAGRMTCPPILVPVSELVEI